MSNIQSLIVKIAERCNLNCSYCYMYNHGDQSYLKRPKYMSAEIYSAMLERVKAHCSKEDGRSMDFTFHGGEPLLIGKERMVAMVREAREVLGDALGGIQVQTNGTLIDDEWARLFDDNGISIGISIDGPPELHDSMRVDHAGKGSHAQVVAGIRHLQNYNLAKNVLCVINPAASGLAAYEHFIELGFKSMNFLIPDVSRDSKSIWYGHLGETSVANYLIPIFDRWFEEDDPSVKISVFRQLLGKLVNRHIQGTDSFGNGPMPYLIIESDGAIQPLDVLRAIKPELIETNLNVLQHGFDDLHQGPALFHKLVEHGPTPCDTCTACPEFQVCGGGYLPHRYSEENGFDNPSAWCEDIKKLVAHLRASVEVACAV